MAGRSRVSQRKRAASTARGQSSPGLVLRDVPAGQQNHYRHRSHHAASRYPCPHRGHSNGRARGCFAPGRSGRRALVAARPPHARIKRLQTVSINSGALPSECPFYEKASQVLQRDGLTSHDIHSAVRSWRWSTRVAVVGDRRCQACGQPASGCVHAVLAPWAGANRAVVAGLCACGQPAFGCPHVHSRAVPVDGEPRCDASIRTLDGSRWLPVHGCVLNRAVLPSAGRLH